MEGEETQTNPKLPDFWGYEKYTREYLLLLAKKGEEGLESIRNYPKKLDIGPDWHQTLNEMEKQSLDGAERWALIGFRDDLRTLVMPRIFGIGEPEKLLQGTQKIPYEVVEKEIQKAKAVLGVEGLVGDIHTHPSSRIERFAKSPLGSFFLEIMDTGPGFSAGDLSWKVAPEKFWPLSVLVDEGENFMVFKTRETASSAKGPETQTQDAFEKYWYDKYGMKKVKGSWTFPGRFSKSYSTLNMNKAIAQSYNLVLYRGQKNSILERIYP